MATLRYWVTVSFCRQASVIVVVNIWFSVFEVISFAHIEIGKDKIEWVKQPVPKFIQDFKQRTNQKESATLDSKHQRSEDDGDDKERDDETPLVCVTSEITAEEAESFIKESYGDGADVRIENPNKRGHEEGNSLIRSNFATFRYFTNLLKIKFWIAYLQKCLKLHFST